MQWDVETTEASESIESCTLCAACEVACPTDNEITTVTLEERRRLNTSSDKEAAVFDVNTVVDKEIVLVMGKGLVEETLLDKAAMFLGGDVSIVEADMAAFESARAVIDEEVVRTIFNAARDVVVLEGLLLRPLRSILFIPERKIVSLGERLLREPSKVRGKLSSTDLYIIDARSYNIDYKRLVGFYDNLKKDVGLSVNFDLHRSAIPVGRDNLSKEGSDKILEAQARWILEGRSFERIVVENPLDVDVFRKLTDAPVVSLMELT